MSYCPEDFRGYIKNCVWKNAKTYEHFAPHEYVLSFPCEKLKADNKCLGDCVPCKAERQAFEDAVMFIREHGERAQFMKRVYTMFCLDDYQY